MFFEPPSNEYDSGTEIINNFSSAFGLDRDDSITLVSELLSMGISPSIHGDTHAEFKLASCFQFLRDGYIKLYEIHDEESDLFHAVYSLAWDCVCNINFELKENGYTDFDFSDLWTKSKNEVRAVVIRTFKQTALNFATKEAAERTNLLIKEAIINKCGLESYIEADFQEPQRTTKEDFFRMTRPYTSFDTPAAPLIPSKSFSPFSKS